MTATTRHPIARTSELAEGDTVVRKSTDERYRVLAVTPGHAILKHPTSAVERVRSVDMLVRSYEVERPEVLPKGLERTGAQAFTYTDWCHDRAEVAVTMTHDGPVIAVSDLDASSVHIGLDAVRFLLAEAEALAARP